MDAIELLCELRDEVRDWEEVLSGERPSLTELLARVGPLKRTPRRWAADRRPPTWTNRPQPEWLS